jgi:hypothetical protein
LRGLGNFLGTLLGLGLLLAIASGAYFLFKYVVNVFAALEPQVETLAAIASVVALLCAVIIAEGIKSRTKAEVLSAVADEKAKIYARLLLLCGEQVGGWSGAPATSELRGIEIFLALHANAKVVAAYNALRRAMQGGGAGTTAPTLLIKLLAEMRGDLGRADFVRNENELIDLMLSRGESPARIPGAGS